MWSHHWCYSRACCAKIASEGTKRFFRDVSDAVSQAVRWVINLAPFGIMGLVYDSVSSNGLSIFTDYGNLLALLVGCMLAIPLGATINMDGAAITITVMTLAAAHTMGVKVDFISALVLSFLATLGACGASVVAGGSLLLIPMACSMFGISQDVAMQVVGIGFIIGVVQDSVETALNSSGIDLCPRLSQWHQHLLFRFQTFNLRRVISCNIRDRPP